MFNTTRQDQTFDIPPTFWPLLHPNDPKQIKIFGSAPLADGSKNPNAPASGEIYVRATVFASIAIGPISR